ncbi:MAG: EcsC family protein [Rhodoblastus sp.]
MADAFSYSPPLAPADRAALAKAVEALEKTSFTARMTALLGRQIGLVGALAPARVSSVVSRAAGAALKGALHVALSSLRKTPAQNSSKQDSRNLHRTLAAASGAAGGAFGLASLPVELPVSTAIMLRSIADIARAEGEDLGKPETALACLQVFALGGYSAGADVLDGGYFAVRGLLAKSISEAAAYVAQKGVVDEAAPVLVRLMGQIAGRFGVVVSQKLAAQAVPLIGAVGGAAVNLAFTDHFQGLAHGHFTVRRLERRYGEEIVRAEYEKIAIESGFTPKARGAAAGAAGRPA